MVPLLPLRDGVRALPISFFRQSMPSFYMNAPDCICSPGRLPLGAFCAGRDARARRPGATAPISIHAPRAGATIPPYSLSIAALFQSTHPVRGATIHQARGGARNLHFNPHTPCGVRRQRCGHAQRRGAISIHAPRAGCDGGRMRTSASPRNFNPRTPCGVRHRPPRSSGPYLAISIHAPRAGCDPNLSFSQMSSMLFQSTHPVRGATGEVHHPRPCD